MKKALCVLLAALLVCASLCACETGQQSKKDIRKVMFAELKEYFKSERITDLNVASSLLASGDSLGNYDHSALLAGDVADADFVTARIMLKRSGVQISVPEYEARVARLLSAVANAETLSTRELYESVRALTLAGAEFDAQAVAQSLTARQDEISGGSYEYPQGSGASARVSAEDAAYSLLCYMLIRDSVRTQTLEDTLHDSALVYLGDCIEEDNTVCGADGKANSAVTAKVLVALIACGVPQDGEIATALLNAIHNFAVIGNGALLGYSEHLNGETKRSTASEILFCVTVCLYGNPYFAEMQYPGTGTEIH